MDKIAVKVESAEEVVLVRDKFIKLGIKSNIGSDFAFYKDKYLAESVITPGCIGVDREPWWISHGYTLTTAKEFLGIDCAKPKEELKLSDVVQGMKLKRNCEGCVGITRGFCKVRRDGTDTVLRSFKHALDGMEIVGFDELNCPLKQCEKVEEKQEDKKEELPAIKPCICGEMPVLSFEEKNQFMRRSEYQIRCKKCTHIVAMEHDKKFCIEDWNRLIDYYSSRCETCGASHNEEHKKDCPRWYDKTKYTRENMRIRERNRERRLFLESLTHREIPKRILGPEAKTIKEERED